MRHPRLWLARISALALLGWVLTASPPAFGGVIITATQVGSDVVFSGSGTLDLAALTFKGNGNLLAGIDFGQEVLIGGDPTGFPAVDFYGETGQITAPAPFGTDLFTGANLGTGPRIGVAVQAFAGQTAPAIVVPDGYVSGTFLSSSSTFTGKTLASLGITPGTYTWSWGSGGNSDFLTLSIVPEPGPLELLLATSALLLALRRRVPQR
jgi:hypothetical protein